MTNNFSDIIKSFDVKKILNPIFWTNPGNPNESKIIEDIRNQLLWISNTFIEYLGFDIFVQDIIMTGSLANFNWSEFSDVDIHIMFDFEEAKDQKDLFMELFKLRRTLFNSIHDINIKGFEVEMYVQNSNEDHFSSGVYSLLYDKWITTPERKEVRLDSEIIEKKLGNWTDSIDRVIKVASEKKLESARLIIGNLRDKLKKYRNSGLEEGGEYSYENIIFKILRRNGYIQKLFDFENNLMDTELSLEE